MKQNGKAPGRLTGRPSKETRPYRYQDSVTSTAPSRACRVKHSRVYAPKVARVGIGDWLTHVLVCCALFAVFVAVWVAVLLVGAQLFGR